MRSRIHPRQRRLSRFVRLPISLWFAAFLGFTACAAKAEDPPPRGTLMLVREWNPKTGELVGWLPMHRAAMLFELVDQSKPKDQSKPEFDLNDAVEINWVHQGLSERGRVKLAPKPREFEGESWLPTKREFNLVRIAKRLFLIRWITLGESHWRLPTQPEQPADEKK